MKGETAAEVSGLADGDAGPRHPHHRARPAGGPGRHRRGRGAHGQHLHDGRHRRRRGGRPGGQARQPGGLLGLRRGRRAGGARGGDRPAAGVAARCWWRRSGSRSCSRRSTTRRCGTPPCRGASWGCPTVFNFLGPVANPARPGAQAVGVADPRMGPVIAGVLAGRGCSALVFHGDDGLDELTTADTSTVWVVHDGTVSQTVLRPGRRWGCPRSKPGDLRGGDAAHNAAVARAVLAGRAGPDPGHRGAQRRRRAGRRRRRARGRGPGRRRWPTAVPGRRPRWTPGAARRCWTRWVAASQRLAAGLSPRRRERVVSWPRGSRARTRPRGRAVSRCGTRCASRCGSRPAPGSACRG